MTEKNANIRKELKVNRGNVALSKLKNAMGMKRNIPGTDKDD